MLNEFRDGYQWLDDLRADFHNIPCNIINAWAASRLAQAGMGRGWLIETREHAVAWDGKHTWDLMWGVCFQNWRYPDPDPPVPIVLNEQVAECVSEEFRQQRIARFYSEDSLDRARQGPITVTRMNWVT